MKDIIYKEIKKAMQEGGNLALDSCVRLLGQLVEKYTLNGKPAEAMGAAGAMEMVKELRKHSASLYGDRSDG
jgi:hypothetical protein